MFKAIIAKQYSPEWYNNHMSNLKEFLGEFDDFDYPRHTEISGSVLNLIHNFNLFIPDNLKTIYNNFIEDSIDDFPKDWRNSLLNGASFMPEGTRYKDQAQAREALGLSKDIDLAAPIDKLTTPKKGTKRIVKADDDGNPEVINNPCKD